MRWDTQELDGAAGAGELPGLGLRGLVRSVTTPEFAGVTFHEVAAKSLLNRVPSGSAMPYGWTINPYRGCTHACTYCFARPTHTYLDLDAGEDFDRQIVVKVNAADVLHAELRRPGWNREHVAMGTNTDPYQRAEGRYRLMPGIVAELARSGTPFSILTKGTLLRRDLPLLTAARKDVAVGLGVSLTLLDAGLQASLEPGTPSPAARLGLVRAARDAGLDCGVFVAPVLPWLTDSADHLDALLAALADAGASGVTVTSLHLKPHTREWFLGWLGQVRPDLVPRYQDLYRGRVYAPPEYRRWLAARVAPLLARHGFARGVGGRAGADIEPSAREDDARYPAGALAGASGRGTGPAPAVAAAAGPDQDALF
ncbi:Radical SAM domain protein [Beutenbergia cavernae DSM 12333]|uniref:Radical SAM domain protein n=1 Tax=Beutenbergia cavernae (strain ATCC BAA-8 / DSM 12333 / CCUG 43141 / JCM 11478 / NBRC 16432 / NCIMB 13614 / HKI 0122) TaxID=471853 RepID=C5C5R8_BEUC1|nr:Rv2578c family radical SAM protein [Beutenbergia cavernae]ACQ80259.1 Radical SAM domain protein [Beutenbergia cavernae DSM 12333]